jgi:hypothetical protein
VAISFDRNHMLFDNPMSKENENEGKNPILSLFHVWLIGLQLLILHRPFWA